MIGKREAEKHGILIRKRKNKINMEREAKLGLIKVDAAKAS